MTESLPSPDAFAPNAIAVVGMAARFPGASSTSAFWDNLRRGEESIVTLTEEQLSTAGVSGESLANPLYIRRAPLIDGIDEFDAEFFGFPPQAARTMDPQHRLFLQCAWHALEDAGCDPAEFDGAIGVYGTSGSSTYMLHNLLSHHDPNAIMAQGATFELINMSLWNDKDYLATRVSHQFNLRGPSMTVQTACSSSMVAVHQACQSLLSGESDMAIAGGVSLRIPHRVGYWYEPGSMVSPTGECRPFDERADGTVFGSGVAIVVLKTLQAAIDDGDRIHAVIRGSAVNNDGSVKMTYAAPNVSAQADVIAEAHAVAEVDASTISYVETHGTGTPLGDPIEIEGLRRAFGLSEAERTGPCAIGSVKANIGHLSEASGIAGLIKTILCLKNRAIPGTLHFTAPNPALHLEDGLFQVQREYAAWECDGVRRAGVSSFGVGGTNVHVVVEEAPSAPARQIRQGPQVLTLSARTGEALDDHRSALAAELERPAALEIADVAHTLAGRRREGIRMAAVVRDQQDAAAVLRADTHDNVFVGESVENAPSDGDRVVFLFPGQGAQHVGMAQGLYESEPVFAEHFDRCVDGFREALGIDLREEIFDPTKANLERTDRAQPALFAVEYSLAQLISSHGIRPAVLAGHSIGEYVAATLAGVFDLPTAIQTVAVRARLMHESGPGSMVAVPLGEDAIAQFLAPGLDVAAINDPGSCVVAGSHADIRALQSRLQEQGIVARRVRTAHAFHSSLMDAVVPEFAEFLSGVRLGKPHTPLLSNVTGTWMTDDEATDPARWARQIRATVRFADELATALAEPDRVLVEIGPGGTLTGSAIRHPKWDERHRAVRPMRHHVQQRNDQDVFLLALGQLWAAGVEVDWTPLTGQSPARVSLPGYPFQRQRHWVDPNRDVEWSAAAPAAGEEAETVSAAGRSDKTGKVEIEATLQQIWKECLGVGAIGVNDDFFEIGGDSLIAIGVAMSATNRGLDLTPQDLYEHPSVTALASALAARYAATGLADLPVGEDVTTPVPGNVAQFLESGLRDAGAWRVPLILSLDASVGLEDVQAVLSAVTGHHEALRMRVVERLGSWEQSVAPVEEPYPVATRTLPPDLEAGGAAQREAVMAILADDIRHGEVGGPALTATYVVDAAGQARYLAVTLHAMVADGPSREILLTDIFTAFGQRLAGQDIALAHVTATWREWSQRCAALTAHPTVLDSRDFWVDSVTRSTVHLANRHVTDRPSSTDMMRIPLCLNEEQTADVDRARHMFQFTVEEVLLGALSRAIANVAGEGVLTVDLAGDGRSVLKPDIDPRRTIGGFSTLYPIPLTCAGPDTGGGELLDAIHRIVESVPHHGVGYGLLRYLYAPTARMLARTPVADVFLCNEGVVPEFPVGEAPVRLDHDAAMPLRDRIPGLGHAIEVRVYRAGGVLHCDWWYDARRLERSSVDALVHHFASNIGDLVADAVAATRAGTEFASVTEELALVDLSAE